MKHLTSSIYRVLACSHLICLYYNIKVMEKDNVNLRVMKRRGRPRKISNENSAVRKTRTLRFTRDEEKLISQNAQKCKLNFSEYCRRVLMNYKPSVPDSEFKNELFAARRDIVNFINIIRGLNLKSEERKKFISSMPVLQEWWRKLFPMIKFIDRKLEKM